jgi:hypothetical protein
MERNTWRREITKALAQESSALKHRDLDKTSMEEIDAEVTAVRSQKKAPPNRRGECTGQEECVPIWIISREYLLMVSTRSAIRQERSGPRMDVRVACGKGTLQAEALAS